MNRARSTLLALKIARVMTKSEGLGMPLAPILDQTLKIKNLRSLGIRLPPDFVVREGDGFLLRSEDL